MEVKEKSSKIVKLEELIKNKESEIKLLYG